MDTTVPYGAAGTLSLTGMLAWAARVFAHPSEVAASPALTLEEKREILASWASDRCGVESAPALRLYPGTDRPVQIDEVLAALRSLDPEQQHPPGRPFTSKLGLNSKETPESRPTPGVTGGTGETARPDAVLRCDSGV